MRHRKTVFAVTALMLAAGCCAAAYLTRVAWLHGMARMLVRSDRPFTADAVSVLGGDWFGDRILKAGELVRAGYAPFALVSGTGYVYGRYEAELGIQFAVAHGYDPKYFRKLEFPCTSTQDEAQAVVRELRAFQVKRLMVVTSPFHTARAGRIFEAAAPDFEIRVVPSQDTLGWEHWWTARESRKAFLLEWTKSLTARVGV